MKYGVYNAPPSKYQIEFTIIIKHYKYWLWQVLIFAMSPCTWRCCRL